MITLPLKRPSLAPRNWPGWLGVGLIWLLGKMPQKAGLVLSGPLGKLMGAAMKRRRQIALRNIERCFPELNGEQREALVRDSFNALARALFEIAWSWSASTRRILRMSQVDGMENFLDAEETGRGVLLITAHLSCLEIGGRIVSETAGRGVFSGMYRPLKSEVLEWYQTRSRLQYGRGMISKRDMRSAIRYLRKGGILWYAPDQDFGPEQSLFAPFFGIQTATLLATHRLVAMTGCVVVPMFPVYDAETRRYTVRLLPALEDFPSDDAQQDLARLNAVMEAHVRTAPEQYWWIHRRFKTRPEGEAPFYD
jgi:KDO2-lipid IV(A) lauroyltransferase